MKTLSFTEFMEQLDAQKMRNLDRAVVCPMCGTVQSQRLMLRAGATDETRETLGVDCVGRLMGRGSPADERGLNHGCNWTLCGFFQTHTLEVITPDGVRHPHFEPATPEQARKLAVSLGVSCE